MAENDRFPVKLFPSASATDVLFYTLNGPRLDKRKIPVYGTPYNEITPRVEDWPDHKLVHVSPPDGDGMQRWFFAADRANQDAYNFERKRVEIGGVEYDAVTRTYVTLRTAFTPGNPAIGSAMPNVPEGLFTGDYKLYDKDQGKVDMQELDSLYVIERRTYVNFTGGQEKTKGQGSLKPAKYKRLVTEKTTRTLHPLAGETIPPGDLIPTPPALSGDEKEIVFQKRNDEQFFKTVVEETPSGASELVGEEYGEIVTQSVSENVVTEGTAADTGMDVISSVVSPFGDGDAAKVTKRVKGGVWPYPVEKEVSKEGADLPPARYRKDITRTKTTRKIATGAIPSTPSLSGSEVAKSYKKENEDRAEETIVTQTFTLNTSSVDEALEQKPFVTIRSRMTPGTAPVLPASGNGSSRLVYEAPDGSKTYENTAEVATARAGPSGTEKDEKPFLRLTTNKRYSTDPTVATATGSSNVVFNDGTVLVYEVSEVSAEAKPYALIAGKDAKLGYRIDETEIYSGDPSLSTKIGTVGVAYDDGAVRVYKKTEVRASLVPTNFDSAVKSTKIFTETTKTSFKNSATGDSDKDWEGGMVYTDGDNHIYRIDETHIAAKTPFTYYSVVHASMPSVLKSLLLEPIEMLPNSSGAVRDKVCVRAIIEEGYSGLFKAKIVESYTEDSNEAESFEPLIFKPTRIDYDGLNYSVSIGETLHQQIVFEDSIGSSDPDYAPSQELSYNFRKFDATEGHTTIPSGWQPHAIQVEPYKNGFLLKKIYIQYKK